MRDPPPPTEPPVGRSWPGPIEGWLDDSPRLAAVAIDVGVAFYVLAAAVSTLHDNGFNTSWKYRFQDLAAPSVLAGALLVIAVMLACWPVEGRTDMKRWACLGALALAIGGV